MEIDNEQSSSAENEEVIESDVAEQDVTQADETDASESSETDEQKNERALAEETTKRAAKEEKRQLGVQRRIDELTAARYQEKARADALQSILDSNLGKGNQPQSKEASEPNRDNFESYEDYLEAKASYKAEQIVQKHLEQYQTQQKEVTTRNQAEQSRKESERQFLERRATLEKEIPDYRDIVEDWDTSSLPSSLVDMLIKLPEGPLVSYHMAKNPALEAQFRDQPEYMHGVILGQLIASLKSSPKISAAPAPGKPVSSSKAGSSTEPPSDPEQYFAWAQKNLR